MARLSYLMRRGASYYARIRVPLDLVGVVGKNELVKALGTKDEPEAKRRLLPVIEAWNREFDDYRSRRQITADDKAAAVWQHYEATLEHDDVRRRSMPTPAMIDAEQERLMRRIDKSEITSKDFVGMINAFTDYELMLRARTDDANNRNRRLAALSRELRIGDTRLIEPAVQKFIADNRLLVDPNSDDYRELATYLMRAEIEGLERTLERDQSNYGGTPKDPIVKPATGKLRHHASPGESIMELFDAYAKENPKGIAGHTLNQARRDVGTFVDFVGSTYPAHMIDKKAIREWKALLLKFPVKATESKEFAGMKIAQIVRHNEKIGKPVISTNTVNRYLSGLSAFCSWLVSHGYLEQNPAGDMFVKKSKKRTTIPFMVEQMNTLFKSPLFTGCQNANEWRNMAKPGNVLIRDHRYWLPFVMLFSGARPGEIAQLALSDVKQAHGQWVMHITTEGDGDKSVKTEGSMRVVPIHDELIRLGFLKYHADIKAKGEGRLFPEAKRSESGQMIADFSREFGRYLIRLKMKDGRGLSLYSFRHGVADALRRVGNLDDQFRHLLGHTSATMTGRYGVLPQGMVEKDAALINSIAYPGLNLDHLIPVE